MPVSQLKSETSIHKPFKKTLVSLAVLGVLGVPALAQATTAIAFIDVDTVANTITLGDAD
jgi:hypothetical protein